MTHTELPLSDIIGHMTTASIQREREIMHKSQELTRTSSESINISKEKGDTSTDRDREEASARRGSVRPEFRLQISIT